MSGYYGYGKPHREGLYRTDELLEKLPKSLIQGDCAKTDVWQRALVNTKGIHGLDRVIVTLGSVGYGVWLDDLLGSIEARGEVDDVPVVVFIVGDAPDMERVCAYYATKRPLHVIRAQPLVPVTPAIKALIYSLVRWVTAETYLCLELDMVVLGSLKPLFEMSENSNTPAMFGVRPADVLGAVNVPNWIVRCCEGKPDDGLKLIGCGSQDYGERVLSFLGYEMEFMNGGLMVGNHHTFCMLDAQMQIMSPFAPKWVEDAPFPVMWRDEHVYNIALHALSAAKPLKLGWNASLHVFDLRAAIVGEGKELDFTASITEPYPAQPVKILHFANDSKTHCIQWRGHFAQMEGFRHRDFFPY